MKGSAHCPSLSSIFFPLFLSSGSSSSSPLGFFFLICKWVYPSSSFSVGLSVLFVRRPAGPFVLLSSTFFLLYELLYCVNYKHGQTDGPLSIPSCRNR